MKKNLLFILFCCIIFSCQKGIHWDLASTGFLPKDSNGNCLYVTVNGNYVADSTISGDNFILVDVNVTGFGSYNIYTDSINGYLFKASGNFDKTGIYHVKLVCSGKPVAAGTDYFTIHYDTSICEAVVTVTSNAIPTAIFSLQGAPGNCLNNTVTGDYVKGITLDTSDKVSINVNVVTPGRYDMTTSVVNGYSFSATGTFAAAGVQSVTMFPTGTPLNEGKDAFKVLTDSSTCTFEVQVKSDSAEFTLQESMGKCMNDSVMGTYVKGVGLDTVSKATISVNVTVPGKYLVTTNIVNGYSFIGAGTFSSTGVQIIILYAEGIPINGGVDIFSVTAGTTSCSFEVTVLPGFVSVTGDDYFPLTDSSYWIYDDLFAKGNTIKRSIDGTSTANGKVYSVMKQTDNYGSNEQFLFRRNDADYLEYGREDKYTASFQYDKNIFTDLLFLNQYVGQGTYWESPEFEDTATFGQVIFLKYGYKCLKTNAVVAVNGNAFANVCIIEMRPQIHSLGNPWGSTNEIYTCYYAKGVGLIYYYAVSNFGYRKAEMQLKSWLVK